MKEKNLKLGTLLFNLCLCSSKCPVRCCYSIYTFITEEAFSNAFCNSKIQAMLPNFQSIHESCLDILLICTVVAIFEDTNRLLSTASFLWIYHYSAVSFFLFNVVHWLESFTCSFKWKEILILSYKHLNKNINSTLPSNQDCRSKLLPVNCFILLPGGTFIYHVKFLDLYHKQQHTWLLSFLPFLVLKCYLSKFCYFCSITEITARPN